MRCRSGSLVVVGLALLLWPCALRAQEGLPTNKVNNAAGNAGNIDPFASLYFSLATNNALGPTANATPPPSQDPIGTEAPPTPPADVLRPFTPFMLGDFVGFVTNQFSDMKIAEGESPQPLDRVFYRFNWYNNVAPAQWTSPTATIHNVNLYRNVIGLEKTVLGGNYSLGLRIPFNTLEAEAKPDVVGEQGIHSTQFGNVTGIFKAVLWEDRPTGDLISAGVTLSLPTASSFLVNPSQSIVLYVQPYGAFIYNSGDLFFQGFMSITAPILHTESIVLFTDFGVGYWWYRNPEGRLLTAFAPTFEIHIADPLRQPDSAVLDAGIFDTLRLNNVVDLTVGTTLEFATRTTLGLGLVVPVTGPRPFDVELLAQLNYRF
jgi:hypothetical protein